jgi:hypothetical protein
LLHFSDYSHGSPHRKKLLHQAMYFRSFYGLIQKKAKTNKNFTAGPRFAEQKLLGAAVDPEAVPRS